MRRVLFLATAAQAVDLETIWIGGASAERLVDYDAQRHVLEIQSTGLPQHAFDETFLPGMPLEYALTLQRPEDYVQRAAQTGGGALPADAPIGVAANGVALYRYSDADGTNLVEPPPGFTSSQTQRDGCFGYRALNGAYAYRTAPPCLYGDDSVAYESLAAVAALGFGTSVYPKRTAATSARVAAGDDRIVAVMTDGFPLYGPLDAAGEPHAGLDECNGKYDAAGNYASGGPGGQLGAAVSPRPLPGNVSDESPRPRRG